MTIPKFVTEAIDKILENEGGYQDDKADTGNIIKDNGTVIGTNKGITPAAYAKHINKPVENITVADMKGLTEEEAAAIYRNDYYYQPKLNKIKDEELRENVFDMAVNAGQGTAIKLLQRLAGTTADGVIGKQTIKAIEDSGVDTNTYSGARIEEYNRIAKEQPSKAKFLEGWTKRANKYVKERDSIERAVQSMKARGVTPSINPEQPMNPSAMMPTNRRLF